MPMLRAILGVAAALAGVAITTTTAMPVSTAAAANVTGALYTYEPCVGNRFCHNGLVTITAVLADGTLAPNSTTVEAGKGSLGHFSQGSSAVLVHSKNLFIVDTFASTILRFAIDPVDPTNITLIESANIASDHVGALNLAHHPSLPLLCVGAFQGLYSAYDPYTYCLSYASGTLSNVAAVDKSLIHPYIAFSNDGSYLLASSAQFGPAGGSIAPINGIYLYQVISNNGTVSFKQVASASDIAATTIVPVGPSSFLVSSATGPSLSLYTASSSSLAKSTTVQIPVASGAGLSDTTFCSQDTCYSVTSGDNVPVTLNTITDAPTFANSSISSIQIPTPASRNDPQGGLIVESSSYRCAYVLTSDFPSNTFIGRIHVIDLDSASVVQSHVLPSINTALKSGARYGLPEGLAFSPI